MCRYLGKDRKVQIFDSVDENGVTWLGKYAIEPVEFKFGGLDREMSKETRKELVKKYDSGGESACGCEPPFLSTMG